MKVPYIFGTYKNADLVLGVVGSVPQETEILFILNLSIKQQSTQRELDLARLGPLCVLFLWYLLV